VDVFVSQSDPRPLTVQLYEQLGDAIIEGRLDPVDRLAPTRALAANLWVSRSTVTEVYSRLVAEGSSKAAPGAAASSRQSRRRRWLSVAISCGIEAGSSDMDSC
jgi:GntR family transcriptional regulator/MocR family aminotransferase